MSIAFQVFRDCDTFLVGPEWRNWQTQQTQNLPELCSVWVRLPPPGPSLSALCEIAGVFQVLQRRLQQPENRYAIRRTDEHLPIRDHRRDELVSGELISTSGRLVRVVEFVCKICRVIGM